MKERIMRTEHSQKVEENFRKDLKILLAKHHAEIKITNDRKPCGCMLPATAEITIISEYVNDDGIKTKEYLSFNLQ